MRVAHEVSKSYRNFVGLTNDIIASDARDARGLSGSVNQYRKMTDSQGLAGHFARTM